MPKFFPPLSHMLVAFWVIFLVVFLAATAFSQTAANTVADTTVNAVNWVAALQPFVLTLATALIGFATVRFDAYLAKKHKIEWDEEQRDAFQTSCTNAAGLLIQRIGAKAASAIVDVRSPHLKELIDYVGKGSAQAVAGWGITPDRVATTILAKIQQILPVEGEQPIVNVNPVVNVEAPKPASRTKAVPAELRSHWLTGAAALGLALLITGCTSLHERLVQLTGSEGRAACIEFVGLDHAQRVEDYGLGLLLVMAKEGVGCLLLPTTPGTPSQVVTIAQDQPIPEGALEVVPPPEVIGVPVPIEETLPVPPAAEVL